MCREGCVLSMIDPFEVFCFKCPNRFFEEDDAEEKEDAGADPYDDRGQSRKKVLCLKNCCGQGAKRPCGQVDGFSGRSGFASDEEADEVGEKEDSAEVGDVGIGDVLKELDGGGDLEEGIAERSKEADDGVPFCAAKAGCNGLPACRDEVDVEQVDGDENKNDEEGECEGVEVDASCWRKIDPDGGDFKERGEEGEKGHCQK